MLWRMPSIDEGVERVGLRVDRRRAVGAWVTSLAIIGS